METLHYSETYNITSLNLLMHLFPNVCCYCYRTYVTRWHEFTYYLKVTTNPNIIRSLSQPRDSLTGSRERSQTQTAWWARVGGVRSTILAAEYLMNVCASLDVRTCARTHTHTHGASRLRGRQKTTRTHAKETWLHRMCLCARLANECELLIMRALCRRLCGAHITQQFRLIKAIDHT